MKIILGIFFSFSVVYGAAQTATSVNVSGLQRPVAIGSTPTTGGTLAAGVYYYFVASVDSLGGQSGFNNASYVNTISGSNNAITLNWNAAPFAVSYKIYRSSENSGPWYYIGSTSLTSFTDLGSAGTLSTPPAASTGVGKIIGNAGIYITDDAGNNIITSGAVSGGYSNATSINIGNYFTFTSTGLYGGNGGLLRSYQGIRFEAASDVYESSYLFYGLNNEYNGILLNPHLQKLSFLEGSGYPRSFIHQAATDGPDAVAFNFSTTNTLSNTGARIFSIKNLNNELLSVRPSGRTLINTSNDNGRDMLQVNGNIRAKKLIVETGWSDYVFAEGYKLRSISSLQQFISKNGRLPDIPSAKEVEKDGVSVGETQSLLLKKIEELTLYVIRLNEENQALKKRVASLENRRRTR